MSSLLVPVIVMSIWIVVAYNADKIVSKLENWDII